MKSLQGRETPIHHRQIDTLDSWRQTGQRCQLAIDDLSLPVFFQHAGEGPALLCLHGFPTASWDFHPLWPELTSRFQTFAFDFIGMGFSAKPAMPLTVSLQADVAVELLRRHGVTESHILAHDLGDTVAQELLARQLDAESPIRWLSCTFLNGGLFPESHRPRLIQKLLLSPLGPLVAKLTSKSRFKRSLSAVFGPQTQPSEIFLEDSWHLLTRDGGRSMLPRLIQYMTERKQFRERWTRPLIEGEVPLRLIDGALDPVSGRHLAERYAQVVPNADVVMLDHLGHYPQVEEPRAVLEPFLEFIEPLVGRPTSAI